MPRTKSLPVNVAANLINQGSAVLFPLLTFPYVSRVLRPEGLGRVSFAEGLVQYFSLLATLGIPVYGVRESARCRDDKKALSTLAAELFFLNVLTTGIAALAFSVFMVLSAKARSDPVLFWICAFPTLLMPLGFNWLLGGLEEYVYITVRTLGLRICVVVGIFLFIRTQADFRTYALMMALNTAGVSLLNMLFVCRHISVRSVDWGRLNVWRHIKPVLLVFSLGSVVSIYTSFDKVMLGYLTNDTAVGLYSVADRVVKVVVTLVTSMGAVLLPRASYYIQAQKLGEYRRLTSTTLRLILFVSFPVALGLIVLAGPLVLLLSGRAFEPAAPLVQIMGLNVVMIALSNFAGYQILYPQGKEKLLLYSAVFGVLCNLGLNWFLIPRWHATGAAFSILVTETCVTGVRIAFARGYANFPWPIWSMLKYAVTALAMVVVVLPLRSFLAGTIFLLPLSIGAGAAFYVVVLWLSKDSMLFALGSRLRAGAIAVTQAAGAGT